MCSQCCRRAFFPLFIDWGHILSVNLIQRCDILLGLSLPALPRYWTWTPSTVKCGHTVIEQGWGQATPQLSCLFQEQVPRRVLIAWIAYQNSPVSLSQLHGAASLSQSCASRLQRALCFLTTALGGCQALVALRSPSDKWSLQAGCVSSWSPRCYCTAQQPLGHGREFSWVPRAWVSCKKPVVKHSETSVKLLRGFTGEQSCSILSGQWSVTLLAQSLHHRNPFL